MGNETFYWDGLKSLHLFESLLKLNLDFLQAVKVMKSSHHLLHGQASKGHGSIPGLTSQTNLHHSKSLQNMHAKKFVMSNKE